MIIDRDIKDYQCIINLPRPEPQRHIRMAMHKRAAQFAPFAALTGYEEIVQATAKAHEKAVAGGAVF